MIGAIVGGIGSALGGFLGKRSEQKRYDEQMDISREMYDRSYGQSEKWNQAAFDLTRKAQERNIRDRVADANAAGIHPLYALGAGGVGSPSFGSTAPMDMPTPPSGSAIGSALTGLSSHMARGLQLRQQRAIDAGAAKDFAEAQLKASQAKRIEQTALNAPAATTFPLPPGMRTKRPVEIGPYKEIAPFGQAELPDGTKIQNWAHDESGLEEAGGIWNLGQLFKHWGKKQVKRWADWQVERPVRSGRAVKYRRQYEGYAARRPR